MARDVEGIVAKILTQKEDDWGRYRIKPSDGSAQVLAVGVIPDVTLGMYVHLTGYDENNQYGRQYKITKVVEERADTLSGVRRFLTDGYIYGIGATKGEALVKAFGETAADMFDTELGRAAIIKVKGFSQKTLDKAMPSYEESKKYKGIVIFLNGVGTKGQVEKLYQKYGEDAVKILQENPYRLQMDLDGFGFLRADKIALAAGTKKDSVFRMMAAIKYALDDAEMSSGHCYLSVSEIREKVGDILVPLQSVKNVPDRSLRAAAAHWAERRNDFIGKYHPSADSITMIDDTVSSRAFIDRMMPDALEQAVKEGYLVNDDGRIYTTKMYDTERCVATMVANMAADHPVRFIKKETIEKAIKDVETRKTEELHANGIEGNFAATEEQRDAVFLALMHRLSIISGGPGRGKTAISEIVAHAFLLAGRSYDKRDIIMLAPTGRAAERITESTGYPAMTAHRAVFQMQMGGKRPEGKLILCDESSMLDIYLARKLLRYAENCNLILVGDADQIASVGPGKVLNDLIQSGRVPCMMLKQGHRNSGSIAHNSQLINQGLKLKDYVYDDHFKYFEVTSDNVKNVLVRDYVKMVKQYGIKDVLLCVAMRQRGNACVNRLNEALQETFTRGNVEAKFGTRIFRVGDRVMQTRNDYNFIKMKDGAQIRGVFNGEKGSITGIRYDIDSDGYIVSVEFDDGSTGSYESGTAENLVLSYATTVHKCQGSEAPCVMMAYTFADYMLLNRSLFYTGETRAKKEFRFYGEEKDYFGKKVSAFDVAAGREDSANRNTDLQRRIADIMDGVEEPFETNTKQERF